MLAIVVLRLLVLLFYYLSNNILFYIFNNDNTLTPYVCMHMSLCIIFINVCVCVCAVGNTMHNIVGIYTEQNYERNTFVFAPIFHELNSKI